MQEAVAFGEAILIAVPYAALPAIRDQVGAQLKGKVVIVDESTGRVMPDRAWEREWLRDFRPMRFGRRLWVCPGGQRPDEHDVDEGSAIVQLADNRYTVRALTPLDEFNAAFGAELGDGASDTVGGAITAALGHIPRRGEKLALGRLQFRVLRADNRRPHLFEVVVLPEAE